MITIFDNYITLFLVRVLLAEVCLVMCPFLQIAIRPLLLKLGVIHYILIFNDLSSHLLQSLASLRWIPTKK